MRALVIAAVVVVAAPSYAKQECDPFEGTWLARTLVVSDWHEYTFHLVRRGNELTGTGVLRAWPSQGDPANVPKCGDGTLMQATWEFSVHGTVRDRDVTFETGQATRSSIPSCWPVGPYSPDHFAGHLDEAGAIDAHDTDDARNAVDRRYRFERRSCRP
jgi:hypothetical protein